MYNPIVGLSPVCFAETLNRELASDCCIALLYTLTWEVRFSG